jgi:predicted transposase YbfD/YdcC
MARRRVFVCPEAADLKALDACAHRAGGGNHPRGSGTVEIRYFLLSCRDDPTGLVQAIRRHIENGLHWVLDVTFREGRVRGSSQPGHPAQDRH